MMALLWFLYPPPPHQVKKKQESVVRVGPFLTKKSGSTHVCSTAIFTCKIHVENLKCVQQLGDNCIQNFHLGRYIVGYTVGNLILRRRVSGAVKRDFQTYIRRYTSPNDNFEYGYPHSNALLTFSLKNSENVLCCTYTSSGCQLHKKPLASCIYSLVCQWKATLHNDFGFPTVYRKIYCRKRLTLSNQTSRYKRKRIRIVNIQEGL